MPCLDGCRVSWNPPCYSNQRCKRFVLGRNSALRNHTTSHSGVFHLRVCRMHASLHGGQDWEATDWEEQADGNGAFPDISLLTSSERVRH
jgi:hypothetical protein